MTPRRAVVAGGGLGGLASARALHQRGWHVSVVERAPRLEPVGAAISLWPNALRALDDLGVGRWARSHATLSGPSGVRRPDGRWLARSDVGAAVLARFGDPLVLVHRAELVDALVGSLPDGAVSTATTVTGVDPGDADRPATLHTDAGEVEADLVVAADGIRSCLRGALFPDHPGPRHAGYTAWRMVLPAPDGVETGFETWGRHGQRFAVLPLGVDRLYCYATATAEPGRRAADEVAELGRIFGGWHDPIPRVLASVSGSDVLHQDVEYLDTPLPTLCRGRVVVLGDAAHAMTPDLGQGGCTTFEDAAVLGSLLGPRDDVATAGRAFTTLRLARTTMIARRSRSAGRLYQAPYAVQGAAGRLMGLVPDRVVARGLGPVVDWRPRT